MFCKSCHYELKELAEPRCPECGVDFDPANPYTFLLAVEPTWMPWLKRVTAYGLLFLLALAHCGDFPFPWLWHPSFVPKVLAQTIYYWLVLLAVWHAMPSIMPRLFPWHDRPWLSTVMSVVILVPVFAVMIYVTRETSRPTATMYPQLAYGAIFAFAGVFLVEFVTQWIGWSRRSMRAAVIFVLALGSIAVMLSGDSPDPQPMFDFCAELPF